MMTLKKALKSGHGKRCAACEKARSALNRMFRPKKRNR